jgi:hemerythrin
MPYYLRRAFAMDFIAWNDSLSVGVEQFDIEHKQLIYFINELNNALKIGSSAKTMENTLVQLVKYTEVHFNHEQEYMKLYDYPDLDPHFSEHENLKEQVNDFYDKLKSGKTAFSLTLLTFLKDWLTKHIMGTDMKYKDYFLQKGVV